MKICSICNRVSATDKDHIDCVQMRYVELEGENSKDEIPQRIDITGNNKELSVEIRAILEHIAKEKND